MTEKTLQNPPQLERLSALRAKLYGTDRDDHVAELDMWERKVKKALIFLNLKKHEGIPDILLKANEEIRAINAKLLEDRVQNNAYTPDMLINDSLERQRLLDLRSVWVWFKTLFEEAKTDLNEVDAFLQEQESEEIADDYVGGE